jgi:nicotinamide-nucleotide amidase
LLSIGNELLLGNTINTNASWLAAQITMLGGTVTRITTVADNLEEISKAIRETLGRKPQFLITTGGIGPTFDDMTFKGVSKALHLRLRLNKEAMKMIRNHYAQRFPKMQISLSTPRLKMATFPSSGIPLPNPVGTAPALHLHVRRTEIFCLPGVPSEAEAIFKESLSNKIRSKVGTNVFVERWLRVRGVMESSLAPLIDVTMANWPRVYIKSHPRGVEGGGSPRIELHFSITARNSTKAKEALVGAMSDIVTRLNDLGAKISKMS